MNYTRSTGTTNCKKQDDMPKNLRKYFENNNEEDEEEHYSPSSTNGDYSPSNPWDAPGMSIHDFIQLKYDISETDDEDDEW